MRNLSVALCLFICAVSAFGQEPVAPSKIVSASLFKNGLAVIKREVVLPGPGTFRLEDLPDPVHGTWWVESQTPIETSIKTRDIAVPAGGDVHFQDNLAGTLVTVHFKNGKPDPVSGTVIKVAASKGEVNRFLVLKTSKSRIFIDPSQIALVEAAGEEETTRRERRPVLLMAAPKARKDDKILITYLTHGLLWAPSYRVDISDPKTLTIEMATIVRNDLSDLQDTDLRLISGFSSVEFAHVKSPLAPNQTWETFIQQLMMGQQGQYTFTAVSNTVGHSNASNSQNFGNNPMNFGQKNGAAPHGEGVDLHFQDIGKRTLAKGETLSLSLAKEKAGYERIVEWIIPDKTSDSEKEDAWDALRFKNPFPFPMTGGPAMITAQSQFNGQRFSNYVSAGDETLLRITKALNVRTRHTEHEEATGNLEVLMIGGRPYQKSTLAAELQIVNHRNEDVKLIIRRRFSGELIQADGQPRKTLLEEGAVSVNNRNELVWVLNLKAGEDKRLSYRYNFLAAR